MPKIRENAIEPAAGTAPPGDTAPDAGEECVPVSVSTFSVEVEDAGEVTWTGKIFELGAFPDKDFSLDEEEADAAVADFSPVDIDIEHRKSPFDGKLGRLVAVSRQGQDLVGQIRTPKAVRSLFGQAEGLPVSLTWDRATKRIAKIALTSNPRITDAQLTAAFSVQEGGEDDPRKGAAMKKSLIQKIFAVFGKVSEADLEAALSDAEFADEAPTDPPADPPAAAPADPPATDEKDAEIARLKAELAQRDAERAQAEADRLKEKATAFAQGLIDSDQATPAEREALEAAFTQAVMSDAAGNACFSATGDLVEGAHVATLRKLTEARPKLGLTGEKLPANAVAFASGKNDVDQAQIDRLLEMTPMGQAVIKSRKGAK